MYRFRLYHSEAKGRGVHIRGGRLRNIVLRADTTYQGMLKKCVQEIYSEEQNHCEFYIADGSGIAIWNGDRIEMDVEGSGERARVDAREIHKAQQSQLPL